MHDVIRCNYYYEIVHEVHNKNTQKDNKNMDKLEYKKH